MIEVYKLSNSGQTATFVGKVHNEREVADKIRLKATATPLRVIGNGLSSQPGRHAIYCVTEDDWFSGRTIFNEVLFGYNKSLVEQAQVSDIQLEMGLEKDMNPMNKTVESWDDMRGKYPEDRHEMTEERERSFVNDCFSLYEKEGFAKKFWSPYDDAIHKIGMSFEVVERCPETQNSLETLPLWNVCFEDGSVLCAHPEEIIPSEMRANGCPWFDYQNSSLDLKIQSASNRAAEPSSLSRVNSKEFEL